VLWICLALSGMLEAVSGNRGLNNTDPFGLCTDGDGKERPCRVEVSPEGKRVGTTLKGVNPKALARLQQLAQTVDMDFGINFTTNGHHADPGHAAGTAVDIGYLNGKDIGNGDVTNPGMEAMALKVQAAAAKAGGLKWTGNLGPAGKFNGTRGPLPINDPTIRAEHRNHIHLSYIIPKQP
jgi:hypothetical protein